MNKAEENLFMRGLLRAAEFVPRSTTFSDAWLGHTPFAAWLMDQCRPATLVELGTFSGNSYFTFCQSAAEAKIATRCYAVDTWEGDEHGGFYGPEIHAYVAAHNSEYYSGFSRLLRMRFSEAADYFSDGSVDLLHVDGLHTYEAVKNDFAIWLPKLAPGAIVLFHDTNVRERGFGVWKLWEELERSHPNNLQFAHSHGLGVLQIDGPAEKELGWLRPASPMRKLVEDYFAVLGAGQIDRFASGRLRDEVNSLHRLIEEKEAQINSLCDAAAENDARISTSTDTIAERDRLIDKLREEVAERDGQIFHLENAKNEIASILSSRSWRFTAPLRRSFNVLRSARSRLSKPVKSRLRAFRSSFYHGGKNLEAIQELSKRRNICTPSTSTAADLPEITVSVVTYNSEKWLSAFLRSLWSQDYPLTRIHLTIVDNGSTDGTVGLLQQLIGQSPKPFAGVAIIRQANLGFGAGHDTAIREASSEYCLVSNIDVEFTGRSITEVVRAALADEETTIASWEMRQVPYEHPKYYDPVTLETNWCSHACVLLRRSAYLAVGGYDRAIFMYGEDVELSYRFRACGYFLRYVPRAVVVHHTYENEGEIKPLQYAGSVASNLLIRFRFGSTRDRAAGIFLLGKCFLSPPFAGARSLLLRTAFRIISKYERLKLKGKQMPACFPLRAYDFEMIREGSFYPLSVDEGADKQLVTVITRTYGGREFFLKESMRSVFNQTYDNIELIVVEDSGETQRRLVESLAAQAPSHCRVIFATSVRPGRSHAGNEGLALSSGKYVMFLDDDDLLFPDHVEVLVKAIHADGCDAAYSLAMEVATKVDKDRGLYTEESFSTPPPFCQEWDYGVLLHHNFIPIQALLFNRDLYVSRGGFDVTLDQLEDWNLWLRYGHGKRFKFVPKTTSLYRVPADIRIRQHRHDLLASFYQEAKRKAHDHIVSTSAKSRSTQQGAAAPQECGRLYPAR